MKRTNPKAKINEPRTIKDQEVIQRFDKNLSCELYAIPL